MRRINNLSNEPRKRVHKKAAKTQKGVVKEIHAEEESEQEIQEEFRYAPPQLKNYEFTMVAQTPFSQHSGDIFYLFRFRTLGKLSQICVLIYILYFFYYRVIPFASSVKYAFNAPGSILERVAPEVCYEFYLNGTTGREYKHAILDNIRYTAWATQKGKDIAAANEKKEKEEKERTEARAKIIEEEERLKFEARSRIGKKKGG